MLNRILWIVKLLILLFFTILFVFPTIWMFVSSTKFEAEIANELGSIRSFIPNVMNIGSWLDPYRNIFIRFNFLRYFMNSVFYSFVIVFGSLFVNSLAGYALANFEFPFKKTILGALLILIIFPFQSMLIQIYLIISNLNLTNTVWGLALPHIGSAFYIYLFMIFFKGIPKSLREAACIDGASEWKVYTRIALPISKPIFLTVGILVFIGSWNDFVWPLMVFTESSKYPLSVAINIMNETQPVFINQVAAGLTIMTIPVLIIYVFGQKYIASPHSSSGIK